MNADSVQRFVPGRPAGSQDLRYALLSRILFAPPEALGDRLLWGSSRCTDLNAAK
jgi:hypothetical protein